MTEYEKARGILKVDWQLKRVRELTKQKGVPFGIIRTLMMIKKSFEN